MNRLSALGIAAASLTTATLASAGAWPAEAASVLSPIAPPKSSPVLVAVVVGDGATLIDFAGPWEVFQDAAVPGRDNGAFDLAMVSDERKPLDATGGMIITPRFAFDDSHLPQPNVIVIGAQGQHTPRKIEWIRKAGERADVVMSVCTGAFLLAKTGLLDGMKATTHHDFYDRFAAQFPMIELVRGPRYIENDGGKFCTAGGLMSGIELALRVVQRYFGDTAATQTAYYMEYNRSATRPIQA